MSTVNMASLMPNFPSNQVFTCKVCRTTVCGEANWNAHLNGVQHQRRLRGEDGTQFHCDLCDVDISGTKAMNEHINGKSHQNRLIRYQVALRDEKPSFDITNPMREIQPVFPDTTPTTVPIGPTTVPTVGSAVAMHASPPTVPFATNAVPASKPPSMPNPQYPFNPPPTPQMVFDPAAILGGGNSAQPAVGTAGGNGGGAPPSSASSKVSRGRKRDADTLRRIADDYENGLVRNVRIIVTNTRNAKVGLVVETHEDSDSDEDPVLPPTASNANAGTIGQF